MKSPTTAPTIKDVAARARVSVATAARALGGYGYVGEAARRRVVEAAERLSYQRNALARSLITRTTHTVGLVVADIENPFFSRLARAVSDVVRAHGYELLVSNTDESCAVEREAVRILVQKRVDGLIVAPASVRAGEHLAQLAARNVPLVLVDRPFDGIGVDTVVVDNFEAAYRAAAHLLSLGHRRIALMSNPSECATSVLRAAGYRRALEERKIDVRPDWIRVATDPASAARETAAATALRPRPTAFVSIDGLLTLGVLRALRDAGLSVPGDVSLIGFDDMEWMTLVQPPLSVVRQPVRALGRLAAERLVGRMAGDAEPARTECLGTTLLLRESCAAAGEGGG